ncbi:hypothetical protein [Alsobacter sp. R-9]
MTSQGNPFTDAQIIAYALAALRAGCAIVQVYPGQGRFRAPAGKSAIVTLHDDCDRSRGPAAFDAPSVRRVLHCTSGVFLMVGLDTDVYGAAYGIAATNAGTGRAANVLIVDTLIEHQAEWFTFLEMHVPSPSDIPRVLVSLPSAGGVH